MNEENIILKTEWLAEGIKDIWISNRDIPQKFKPGQFLIVCLKERGERIPLTIVETAADSVRIVVQDVGRTSMELCNMEKGEIIKNVVGPLGMPSELIESGSVVCLAGGIGAAPLKPVASGLKKLGNRITIIEGARSRKYLIMEDELANLADEFILMSDDGSVGKKGLVTNPLKKMINSGNIPDSVFAVGPAVMMKAVSIITKDAGIPLTVSLNPIMVDGTGMCGSCRVEVSGETKFACVDGPEFNGNEVDFDLLINRLKMYEKEETVSDLRKRQCEEHNESKT